VVPFVLRTRFRGGGGAALFQLRRLGSAGSFEAGDAKQGTALGRERTVLIRRADTFFAATAHASRGTDASHRRGNPGFAKVLDETTLRIPDYPGNSMFNTLGNLAVDPSDADPQLDHVGVSRLLALQPEWRPVSG
jgi:predicted pyridoxine 5'-phosphate oxidase superfamily flavin-nucleotide-binding protein